jgi:succinoglycan biosynthesis protein ExoA
VSVVLPVRNEAANLEACLERLLAQDYPEDLYEILVVDGHSSDGTRDVVRRVRARAGTHRIRLLENARRIVPTALNIAICAAAGEVIVRMDGHTVPADDYVSACVRSLRESGAANVGGPMVAMGATPFGRAVAVAQQHPLGVGDAKFHFDGLDCYVDTVYMGAFRREIFAKAGLFDESMVRNQDYEMNVRIRKAGGRIFLDSRIRSTYTPRGSVPGLWRQYFQYGWWRVETIRRHPGSARWRHLAAPALVLVLVTLSVTAPFVPFIAPAVALLGAFYLGVLTLAAHGQRRRLPSGEWILVPVAISAMHLSWGLGFLMNSLTNGRLPYRSRTPKVPCFVAHRTPQREPKARASGD